MQQNPPIGALPLEQVIRDLRDSGIHVLIKTSDFGIMLFITDQLSVVRAERVIQGPKHSKAWPDVDAASWLHSQALALIPESEYARRANRA